jgi:hypothetical protein
MCSSAERPPHGGGWPACRYKPFDHWKFTECWLNVD